MSRPLRVLMIEDVEDEAQLLLRELKHGGFEAFHRRVETGEEMDQALAECRWDLILCDFALPRFSVGAALDKIKAASLDIPFIIVSGIVTGKDAVLALVSGARDFIEKQDLSRFVPAVERELGEAETRRERKLAEESLVKLRKAVDTSGEVIFMTDPDGVFTFVNPEFTRLYGYTEAEVVGKTTPRILKSGATPAEEYKALWSTILSKRVAKWEAINKTKAGSPVNIEGSVNPILDDEGNITGFLAIQRDVTARKQLEVQFRQAQKMEAVGRLAGGVAHDFNNLLTIINGYSQLLLERLAAGDPMRAQVEEVHKAGSRAAALTRQLLAFSRQQVLAPRVLDLNAVVENIQKMLARLIGEDISLVSTLTPGLSPVKADPGQIEQVIMNLAVNARDAMPKGGKLTIETAEVELGEDYARNHATFQPGRYVMLAVSDTGIGMDKETQAHIFEPFFTTKGLGRGTGLGLATVYGIVKQSGGYIWVYSEPGRGSTFKIYLPRVDAPAEAVRAGAELSPMLSRGTETILWVEDEPAVRALVQVTLRAQGYRVLVATHGEEGLRLAEEFRGQIDLLLTDVVMPGMTGPELLGRLKQSMPTIKVLYVSGYADTARLHHGVLDPQAPFLQKPFTPRSLAHKIREVLGKS